MARQIRKKSGTGIYHIKMTGDSPVTSKRKKADEHRNKGKVIN